MFKAVKDNYWLKAGFINILQNMSGVLFGVGGFVFLVRILSSHDYGIWVLFTTTTTIFSVVRDGMIRNALVKFLAGALEVDKAKIMTSALIINVLITVFCVIINFSVAHYLARKWESPEILNLFYLFNLVYLLNGILTQFNCIEQANLKFNGIFLTGFINQGVFFSYILSCYVFKIELPLIHLVLAQLIAVIFSTTVAYFFVKKYLFFAKEISREWFLKLFNYGKYSFGTSVSSILSGTVDKMMLGGIINSAAAGAYDVVIRIINLVDIPTNAMATIVFPQSAKRIESEGKVAIKYLYERSVGAIIAILLPGIIFLYFFADFVIFILADGKFPAAVPMLKITLIYMILLPYGRQFGAILDSIGKTKTTFYMVVFITVFNLTMNYFLIKNYGMIGAPYATLLANVLGFIIAQVILKRELNVNVINPFIYAYYFYIEIYKKFVQPRMVKFIHKGSK